MLDYAALEAVATVLREGSFERAARALNVTPSAVSQRIKALEERLGSVLIVRGQPCTATETGKLLCRHVEQVGMLEHDLRSTLPKLTQDAITGGHVTLRVAVNADSLGTWFIQAMRKFLQPGARPAQERNGRDERVLLDVVLDDQEHTDEWLRSGDVLAAVTANSQPVQGCNSISLGRLQYVAVASPEFLRRHFTQGVTASALAHAPTLTFNRKDRLQTQWMRRICRREVDAPTHWLPSTQAFIDASLAGIGWGMNPTALVQQHLRSGALVELVPGRPLWVPLYWQHTRLQVPMLSRLTQAVISVAKSALSHAHPTRSVASSPPADAH